MEGTLMKFFAKTIERDRLIQMLFDVAAYRLHAVRLWVAVDRSGTATQASAISGLLGFGRPGEELHIFTPWADARHTMAGNTLLLSKQRKRIRHRGGHRGVLPRSSAHPEMRGSSVSSRWVDVLALISGFPLRVCIA